VLVWDDEAQLTCANVFLLLLVCVQPARPIAVEVEAKLKTRKVSIGAILL
jgi:hypothetical protein